MKSNQFFKSGRQVGEWTSDPIRSQGKVKLYMFQWAVLDLDWTPFQLLNLACKLYTGCASLKASCLK